MNSKKSNMEGTSVLITCKNEYFGCDMLLPCQEMQEHEKECKLTGKKCSAFGSCQTIASEDEILDHEKKCRWVKLTCDKCESEILRKDISAHGCEDKLKSRVDHQLGVITELKNEIKANHARAALQEKKIQEQEEEIESKEKNIHQLDQMIEKHEINERAQYQKLKVQEEKIEDNEQKFCTQLKQIIDQKNLIRDQVAKIAAQDSEIKAQTQMIRKYQAEVMSLNKLAEDQEKEINRQNTLIKEQNIMSKEQEKRMVDLNSKILELEKKIQIQKQNLLEKDMMINELVNKENMSNTEKAELNSKIKAQTQAIQSERNKNDGLGLKNQELESDIRSHRLMVEEAIEQLKDKDHVIENHLATIKEYKAQDAKRKDLLIKSSKDQSLLEQKNMQLKIEYETLKKKYDDLKLGEVLCSKKTKRTASEKFGFINESILPDPHVFTRKWNGTLDI